MKILKLVLVLTMVISTGCMQVIDAPKGSKRGVDYGNGRGGNTSAATIMNDAAQSLADQLAAYADHSSKRMRVAIQPILDKSGRAGPIAPALYESLRTKLFQTGKFDVVADSDMRRVLAELKINERLTSALDPESRQGVGNLTGANAFVDGRITDSISHLQVNLELIDIDTGQLEGSAQYLIPNEVLYSFGFDSSGQVDLELVALAWH